jgi:hypothetical protein
MAVMAKKTKTVKRAVVKKKSRLVGFARLKVTDPDKLSAIAKRAGKRAQQLHGRFIRWTKAEARAMAQTGGKAVQKQYRKTGHPLQIAQVKREAIGKKIRAGLRKRKQKAKAKPAPEPQTLQDAIEAIEAKPEQEPDPVPEKDVVNG